MLPQCTEGPLCAKFEVPTIYYMWNDTSSDRLVFSKMLKSEVILWRGSIHQLPENAYSEPLASLKVKHASDALEPWSE